MINDGNRAKESRKWQFDYLKALGIICVIVMHIWLAGYDKRSFLGIVFPYFFSFIVPMFMMISGYFYVLSWEKSGIVTVGQYFRKQFIKKMSRVLVPFLLFYGIEVIVLRYFWHWDWLDWKQILYWGVQGGFGPGSYYIPVLIQIIILFPFLYILFRKNHVLGSIAIAAIQTVLELCGIFFHISSDAYRLLAFRYFIFLWVGMLLYHYKSFHYKWYLWICAVFGGIYIYIINFTGYSLRFYRYWVDCSLPTALLFGPLFVALVKLVCKAPPWLDRAIRKIGESTLFIYLVQMFFYQLKLGEFLENIWLQMFFNVTICVTLGCILQKCSTSIGDRYVH